MASKEIRVGEPVTVCDNAAKKDNRKVVKSHYCRAVYEGSKRIGTLLYFPGGAAFLPQGE